MTGRRLSIATVCRADFVPFSDRQILRKDLKRSLSPITAPRSVLRLRGYLAAVFSAGLPSWEFNFAQVCRRTGLSRRTIERALAWMRRNPCRFVFSKRRVGRSYSVRVSDRQNRPPLSPVPPIPPAGPSGIFGNTASRVSAKMAVPNPSRPPAPPLQRLAAFLARKDLAGLHWDNCKVSFRFPHAFRFAAAALARGFDRRQIVRAYERALIKRHQQATDAGAIFAPSSTVTLARQMLADGMADPVRIRNRLEILAPAKAEAAALRDRIRQEMAALSSPNP